MPAKAQALWTALGQPGHLDARSWESLEGPPVAGARTSKPENLFPRPV
jgi:methionyl-tRNA synthetase